VGLHVTDRSTPAGRYAEVPRQKAELGSWRVDKHRQCENRAGKRT
jgi:hypothetical protein